MLGVVCGSQDYLKVQATVQLSRIRLTGMRLSANFTAVIQVLNGLITTSQAAKKVGRTVQTVNRWVQDGHLVPAGKMPGDTGTYLFTEEAVAKAAATIRPYTHKTAT